MNLTLHSIHFIPVLKIAIFVGLCFFATHTFAATLSVSPGTGVYSAGQTFTARVVINTAGQNINAAEGTISFKPTELSVVSIAKGSIFNLWTAEPSFSNGAGTISFSGGTPTGYTGGAGTVLSITFRAKSAGTPRVEFSNGAVLAADGRGTNVLTRMNGGSYTISAPQTSPEPEVIEYVAPANTPAAPKINSLTHTDPDAWYTAKDAVLSWTLPVGITAVRTSLDSNAGSIPTKVYDDPISTITLRDLDQGVQYFHIQLKNEDGWGRVTHYRLAVDSEKPSAFTIALTDGADLSGPEQTLVLTPEDATSAVTRYLVQIDGGEPYEYIDTELLGLLKLPLLEPGHHSVIIEAFDQAGNSLISTFSFGILAFDKPQFTEYPDQVSENVIPVIKGITRPNAEVVVTVTKIGSDTQEVTLQSTASGEFVYIPESRFSLGVYELSAVAIDQYGAQSEVSDVVRIAVQQPGYVRVGSFVVSLLSVVIPLIALVMLLVFGIWFLFIKMRRLRTGVTRETDEALVMLSDEFEKLQNVLTTQASALSGARKTNKLTKAESVLIESMQSALVTAQKNVQKEITDVENIIE